MARYYVNANAQSNGDHEVHTGSCRFCPEEKNRIFLGNYDTCVPAVREARKRFARVNGCFHCSRSCHTS